MTYNLSQRRDKNRNALRVNSDWEIVQEKLELSEQWKVSKEIWNTGAIIF